MSNKKIKILLDGNWTDWMEIEEIKKYKFTECIIQETMTRAEYNNLYFDFPKMCEYCKKVHDKRMACAEYVAKT